MILVIDNNDSFTYNLIDYIKTQTKLTVQVVGIDNLLIEDVINMKPKAIVISPGPGNPDDYPILNEVLEQFYQRVPGHTTQLRHTNEGIFQGLPQNFNVMRYHSLIADGATFPNCLKITAKNDEAIIMAFEHITFPVFGVQYHPESILSEYGYRQVELFLSKVGDYCENRI